MDLYKNLNFGGAQTTALAVSDGSLNAELAHRMIEFTGTITGNQIVTIPNDVQNFYILKNSTSGSHIRFSLNMLQDLETLLLFQQQTKENIEFLHLASSMIQQILK